MKRLSFRSLGPSGVVLIMLLSSACVSADNQPEPVAEGNAPPAASEPSPGTGIEPSVHGVLAKEGVECLEQLHLSWREPSQKDIDDLTTQARAGGSGDHWLEVGKDIWKSEAAWVGSMDSAADAYGGEIVGPVSNQWILTSHDGRRVAVQLSPIGLNDGSTLLRMTATIQEVDCLKSS